EELQEATRQLKCDDLADRRTPDSIDAGIRAALAQRAAGMGSSTRAADLGLWWSQGHKGNPGARSIGRYNLPVQFSGAICPSKVRVQSRACGTRSPSPRSSAHALP